MVEPIAEQALEQIGPAQQRRVGGVGPPSMTWLPPPVPIWRPSIMNFSRAQPRRARLLVDDGGLAHELGPIARADGC